MRAGRLVGFVLLVGLLIVARPATAGQIFVDNFNTGTWALNYNGFANWTVSGGTVDLIGVGSPFDFQPGNGLYVDMDGSTGNAGILTTKQMFPFLNGVQYALSFDLAGNHRNNSAEQVFVKVSLGNLVNQTFSLGQNAPFQRFTISFTGNSLYSPGALSFEGFGGDNIGMLLDNVELSRVPDGGATLSLLGCGLIGIGALRWRLRR